MKPKNYEVLMDIYMGVLNAPAIQFTTEDFGMCQITFSLLEDRITPYNLSNCLVRMVINGQQQDCTISDANNGKAEIVLLQSMFSEVGPVFAELQIYDATNQTMRLTTPTFKYTVRKSLMDDNTVQADPNYSVLQNMILEVSSADEVAKQAKKTAESAMATANQAESKANQIMSNGDYAKEQGDYAKAEGDRLQEMLTLGGAPQTNFDFIKNGIVKDGLVDNIKNTYIENNAIINEVNSKVSCVYCEVIPHNITATTYSGLFSTISTSQGLSGLGLYIRNTRKLWVTFSDGSTRHNYETSLTCYDDKKYRINLTYIDGVLRIVANNEIVFEELATIDTMVEKISYGSMFWTTPTSNTLNGFVACFAYNKPLTAQEIEHNFSVLDNQQSIKELHTTDSTGKTSILKLASDTDHVEDRSGRTQDQINRTFYKRACKEIPSPNGEPITVENGEEGYVLSGEIKGQTVNSISCTNKLDCFSMKFGEMTIDKDGWLNFKRGTGNKYLSIKTSYANLQPSTNYTLVIEVDKFEVGCIMANVDWISTSFVANLGQKVQTTGIHRFNVTTKDVLESNAITLCIHPNYGASTDENAQGRIRVGIYPEGHTGGYVHVDKKGLNSTQAIISNNGQQYPIYANEEDKANKKVISLDGGITQETDDTLIISDDGSIMLVKNYVNQIIDGSRADLRFANYSEENKKIVFTKLNDGSRTGWSWAKCNVLDYNANAYSSNVAGYGYSPDTNGNTYFAMNSDLFETKDLEGIKKYLNTNPIQFSFVAKTPTITHIPKELVPVILTHNKTNIL